MKNRIFAILIISIFLTACQNSDNSLHTPKNTFVSDDLIHCNYPVTEPNVYTSAYVINDFSKIYKAPEQNSSVIGELNYGRKIELIAKVNDYYSVSYENTFAFVKCSDVNFELPYEDVYLFSELSPIGKAFVNDVPIISQFPDFPTGCEAVSTVMALNFFGEEITVGEFIDNYLPTSNVFYIKNGELHGPDPNQIYVGDPRSESSFGCMSTPIFEALSNYFEDSSRVKLYKDIPLEKLCAKYIDHGTPVLVWVTIAMIPSYPSTEWKTDADTSFTWPANEHCMLMVGYDSSFYYMNDCYKGKMIAYPKEKTEIRYKELGCQAVVIEK